jgi:probable F420-dependent oxidoreductase
MAKIRVGVQLRPQHTTWASFAEVVRQSEALGVDTIWTWDHFFPLFGDPEGTHFEGWSLITAIGMLTSRVEFGAMVTCNTYRNPQLLADMARTVDHISNGRLILGIGAGWFERDYTEYGYEFGTAPDRLRALSRALPLITERWAKLNPAPVRNPIPILIGGGGEKVTLKLTARYASLWNSFGPPETYKHKSEVLDEWCRELGRDPQEIERTAMIGNHDPDAMREAGATHLILGIDDPWDLKAVERLVAWRESQS